MRECENILSIQKSNIFIKNNEEHMETVFLFYDF
jgi:hypothetical protein